MGLRNQSIRRKTLTVIMLTSVVVLLLTAAAFTVYDLATYRQNVAHSLSATAAIIADHSISALNFRDEKDARATLASLRADPRIVQQHCMTAKATSLSGIPPRRRSADFRKRQPRSATALKAGD